MWTGDGVFRCHFQSTLRHGNLREEEKRGFMQAITVQDFNPALRIFVQAPTQEMRKRLVKVRKTLTRRPFLESKGNMSWPPFACRWRNPLLQLCCVSKAALSANNTSSVWQFLGAESSIHSSGTNLTAFSSEIHLRCLNSRQRTR